MEAIEIYGCGTCDKQSETNEGWTTDTVSGEIFCSECSDPTNW